MKKTVSCVAIALGLNFAAVTIVWAADNSALLNKAREHFAPLPTTMATAQRPVPSTLIELGRALFFDPRISVDGTASCVRCHQPSLYGTDSLAKSHGNHDKLNFRNAPTVLNAALQVKQHWIGDREDVEDQATKSLIGPASLGNPDFDAAMARIKGIAGYLPMFQAAFPDEANPINPTNWGKAIGAYERTLVSRSRFDDFLEGKLDALSAAERQGLETFMDTGCIVCHNGAGIGGGEFKKFGVIEDYWKATGSKDIDEGRFLATKDPDDKYVFKVPSLRNVAMTGPYFHDGSVSSLAEAVRAMARLQLGVTAGNKEIGDIVSFLGSLTGTIPVDFATAPVLPAEH